MFIHVSCASVWQISIKNIYFNFAYFGINLIISYLLDTNCQLIRPSISLSVMQRDKIWCDLPRSDVICQLLFPVCQTVWWSVCPSWPAAYLPLYDGCNKKLNLQVSKLWQTNKSAKRSASLCDSYRNRMNALDVNTRCVKSKHAYFDRP